MVDLTTNEIIATSKLSKVNEKMHVNYMSPFSPALTEDDVILADKLRGVSNVRDDTFNTSKMRIEPINAAPMYALCSSKGK